MQIVLYRCSEYHNYSALFCPPLPEEGFQKHFLSDADIRRAVGAAGNAVAVSPQDYHGKLNSQPICKQHVRKFRYSRRFHAVSQGDITKKAAVWRLFLTLIRKQGGFLR